MSDKTDTPRTDALEYAITNFPDKVATARFMRDMERELTKWREVARRLADNIRAHDIDSFGQNAEAFKGPALAAYDALAKSLSDGGKG